MIDIIERLRFDSARCELQFSKGVAGNIEEAAAEIERLRAALTEIRDAHLGDQPAALDVSEYEWACRHISRLRRVAYDAVLARSLPARSAE